MLNTPFPVRPSIRIMNSETVLMVIISKSQLGDKQWPQTVLVKYKLSCCQRRKGASKEYSRKIQFAWDTLTINLAPLLGNILGTRIKKQSPKRVTDYSRTRHVRVRVICIWMVWLLMMGGARGSEEGQDTAAKAAAGGTLRLLSSCPFLWPHWQACGWSGSNVFYGANLAADMSSQCMGLHRGEMELGMGHGSGFVIARHVAVHG